MNSSPEFPAPKKEKEYHGGEVGDSEWAEDLFASSPSIEQEGRKKRLSSQREEEEEGGSRASSLALSSRLIIDNKKKECKAQVARAEARRMLLSFIQLTN